MSPARKVVTFRRVLPGNYLFSTLKGEIWWGDVFGRWIFVILVKGGIFGVSGEKGGDFPASFAGKVRERE